MEQPGRSARSSLEDPHGAACNPRHSPDLLGSNLPVSFLTLLIFQARNVGFFHKKILPPIKTILNKALEQNITIITIYVGVSKCSLDICCLVKHVMHFVVYANLPTSCGSHFLSLSLNIAHPEISSSTVHILLCLQGCLCFSPLTPIFALNSKLFLDFLLSKPQTGDLKYRRHILMRKC